MRPSGNQAKLVGCETFPTYSVSAKLSRGAPVASESAQPARLTVVAAARAARTGTQDFDDPMPGFYRDFSAIATSAARAPPFYGAPRHDVSEMPWEIH